MAIDPRAIIDATARIADDVTIGPWTFIGANVEINSGTIIGPHVTIERDTIIGKNNKIYQFASLGADPQDIGYKGERTYLEIGDHNIIREFSTLNRASTKGDGITRIGNHNFLMNYIHIAHDCIVGNHVIFANNASIAGHVRIDDYAVLGAFTGIHQFCHIGAYSFLGRATKVYQDILPYMSVTGNPGAPKSLNLVGLKRYGFNGSTLSQLKAAYKLFYHRDLKLTEIHEKLTSMSKETPEIQLILDMLNRTSRGIARPHLRPADYRQAADDAS